MTLDIQSFNRKMVFKSEMFILKTIPQLKVLTTVGEQVFENVAHHVRLFQKCFKIQNLLSTFP